MTSQIPKFRNPAPIIRTRFRRFRHHKSTLARGGDSKDGRLQREFFGFARNPSQRPLPTPSHDDSADERYHAGSTRVLRKQSPVKVSATDTRGMITPDDIFERAKERREQRKLRRAVVAAKLQATTSKRSEVKSPGNPHTSEPHPPPYTVQEIANYLNAPKKLTRKPTIHCAPNGWYYPDVGSPLTAPAGSLQTTAHTQESQTPYSESRGELERQFAISQRLQRKYQFGFPSPAEVGAYLGGLERLHDEDGWVDGFRVEVEKPLQRVYSQRLQRGSRGSVMIPEKPKKVRFASVVECVEF